jgi:poly(beta-D-mannuronate) lyase
MKQSHSIVCRLALAISIATSVFSIAAAGAREEVVDTPAHLQGALNRVHAGDVLILKAGEWKDVKIAINHGGSPDRPLLIQAERPGETILNGSSTLEINAPHVIVDGLFFYKGKLNDGAVVQFNSHHAILRNSAIVDYNPDRFETKYYWVFFRGDNNTLDRCYFKGKNHLEPLVGNALEGSRYNTVSNSYFKNIPYNVGNGREDIRVWGSGKYEESDADGAFFTIEGNLFDHADGEGTEIISLKSNHNLIQRNTIVATRGCINIRRGNFNTVKDNIILGEGVEGAQGYRMSGEHNLVQGNYASDCEYGIRVTCGEFIKKALTGGFKANDKGKDVGKVATYPQTRFTTISDNVMVNISGADLEMGSDYKKHWPQEQMVLLPEDCVVKNNRFVRPQGGVSVTGAIPETAAPLHLFHFRPNQYADNRLVGGKIDYAPARSGFRSEPLPGAWSQNDEEASLKSLQPEQVGPEWVIALRKAGTFAIEDEGMNEVPTNVKHHKKKKDKH